MWSVISTSLEQVAFSVDFLEPEGRESLTPANAKNENPYKPAGFKSDTLAKLFLHGNGQLDVMFNTSWFHSKGQVYWPENLA